LSLLIYLPGETSPGTETLNRLVPGLVRSDDAQPFAAAVIEQGPDGGSGMLFGWSDGIRLDRSRQTWEQIPGVNAWMGYETASPPTAESLQRSKQIDGLAIEFGDQVWTVPCVLHLPSHIDLDNTGRPIEKPIKSCETFAQRAADRLDRIISDLHEGRDSFDLVRDFADAVEVLQWNYRLLPLLIARFGWFNRNTVTEVLTKSCDVQRVFAEVESIQKKRIAPVAPSVS